MKQLLANIDPHGENIFPEPFATFGLDVFNQLMTWAHGRGASDIALSPNDPAWMRLHGEWLPVTTREITSAEISSVLNEASRQPNASSLAMSGQDVDFAHEITVGRGQKIRFRVNATGCRDGWSSGVAMVLRTIPEYPPELSTLDLPADLVKAFQPKYGLVLVTGPVGSGKSTTLFSVLRDIAENQHRHIITYESPIEFDLMGVPGRIAPVVQTDIPTQLKNFEDAPRNSLRRAGDVVLFGESRDKTTMRNMSIEAETGVAVYSTVHTNSVAETISRMVREFSVEERDGMAATLIAAMRLVVHQRLVPTKDGNGRVPIREWLIFDEEVRRKLNAVPIQDMITTTQDIMAERGQTLLIDAEAKFEQGLIDRREVDQFRI